MSKQDKLVIQSFEIKLGDTKVTLTREQAEQLRDALTDTLGAKPNEFDEIRRRLDELRKAPKTVPVPYPWPHPDPYPYRPWWDRTIIWTSDTTSNTPQWTCSMSLKA